MRAPARDAGHGKQRRVEIARDPQALIHQAGIEVDIGGDHLGISLHTGKDLRSQPFHALKKVKLPQHPALARDLSRLLLENHRARVGNGVNGMTHSIDQAGMIAHFFAYNSSKVILHLRVALPILHILHQVAHHHHDAMIGAAVTRPLERTDGSGNRRIDVCPRGGQNAGRKGGVIAAAVFRVNHHAQVEKLCLLVGKLPVRTDRVEDSFRCGMLRIERMEEHALFVVMAALDLIGIRHDGRQAGDELHRLTHIVFQRNIIRIVVIGIQSKD